MRCPTCAAELASLRTYLEAMDSLPRVQAPVDFLASVHERLDQPGFFRRLLSRLFFPMKVKLPFEVAGLVAASLLVVLLYRGTEPEKAQFTAVSQAPTLQAPSAPGTRAPLPSASPRPSIEEPLEGSRPTAAPRIPLQEQAKGEGQTSHLLSHEAAKPADQDMVAAKPQPEVSLTSQKPVELVLRLTPRTSLQAAPDADLRDQPQTGVPATPPVGQAQEQSLSRKAASALSRSTGSAEQKASASPATPLSRIKALVKQAHGSVLSADREKDTHLPQVVVVQIPARGYDTFVEQLGHLGQLEKASEKPKVPNQDTLIRLQIRLVPPA